MVTKQKQERLDLLLEVLRSLPLAQTAATVGNLAQRTGLTLAIVRSLLAALQESGVVERARAQGDRAAQFRLAASAAAASTGAQAPAAPSPASPPPPVPPRGPTTPTGEPPLGSPHDGASSRQEPFDSFQLDRMVISLPLEQLLREWQDKGAALTALTDSEPGVRSIRERTRMFGDRFSIIIDLNLGYRGGVVAARQRVYDLLLMVELDAGQSPASGSLLDPAAPRAMRDISEQYIVARLRAPQIRRLVMLDQAVAAAAAQAGVGGRAIFRIWPDNVVQRQGMTSMPTIKADAARNSFSCTGQGIVWAVIDSGIDGTHPHFEGHRNLLDLPSGVEHTDLSGAVQPSPLTDEFGHGSHVAGTIAGALTKQQGLQPVAVIYERDANATRQPFGQRLDEVSGVAPQCKLVSYKVLDASGRSGVTEVMAALEAIQRVNGYGKSIRIHGVNMSLGYSYDPEWFACGHSPLCEVVDRLARSGVCVVVAAGNSGYGTMDSKKAGPRAQGMPMSINDPGNAERAITVGSTHRDSPHTYGVSFFSSKGPTGDGRCKPDLIAPGEKIVSCLSTQKPNAPVPTAPPGEVPSWAANPARYIEDSGTSMAAPHVSGAIAALLSVRREFIGRSEELKRVFLDSALDLRRDRNMQGHGLLNLFGALQSI